MNYLAQKKNKSLTLSISIPFFLSLTYTGCKNDQELSLSLFVCLFIYLFVCFTYEIETFSGQSDGAAVQLSCKMSKKWWRKEENSKLKLMWPFVFGCNCGISVNCVMQRILLLGFVLRNFNDSYVSFRSHAMTFVWFVRAKHTYTHLDIKI